LGSYPLSIIPVNSNNINKNKKKYIEYLRGFPDVYSEGDPDGSASGNSLNTVNNTLLGVRKRQ